MLRSGDQIGPYTLINKLGRGAFGTVWLSERRTTIATTTAALKIPLDDDIDLETIKHEANLWVRASGHPNVLPIIEANIYGEQVVIASEYAPDGSLESWLKQHGKAPTIEAVVEIISGVLAGLEHLHSRNIIHRDVKPANILFQGITPRLADFGISRVLKSTSQSSIVAGTPAYMAPEAFDGKRNEQTDIWSVGVIFYQLLAGRLPFAQADITSLVGAILSRNPDPLPITVPSPLQEIIARALAKDPRQRYPSASEMRADLRNPTEARRKFQYPSASVITSPASPANTIPPASPPLQSVRRRSPHLIYATTGLLAVMIIVLGVIWLKSGTTESSINNSQTGSDISTRSNVQNVSPTVSKPTRGSFQVYAASSEGNPFINPYNQSVLIHFQASGQWTFFPRIGFCSAAGYENNPVAGSGYALPSKPPGSLIVRRGNGNYEYVGEERIFRVEPNERIVFLINDDIGQAQGIGFADNQGSLTITWECQNCSQ